MSQSHERHDRRTMLPHEPWRRNQVAVNVAAAMVFLGFTLVMPFLPFYVMTLGVTDPAAVALWSGVYMTISPLLAAILGPFWGRLADRVGMRIMVQRVLFTIALHWGLMYFAGDVWQVLGLRVMLGLFSGFGTMSVALVTHGCPRERIGRAVGTLQATQILSSAIGPFVGGLLAHTIGIRSTFLVTCALCTTAFFFVRLLYRDTPSAAEAEAAPVVLPQEGPVTAGVRAVVPAAPARTERLAPTLRRIFAMRFFLPLLPMLFCVNLVDRSLFLSVPLAVARLEAGHPAVEAVVGVVMSAGALASAASAWILGRRAGAVAPVTLLVWSLACSAASILAMAWSESVATLATLRVLLGFAAGGAATLAYTMAGEVIPATVRATAYGILSSVALLGGAMGPILTATLVARQPRSPFLVGGAIYLALTAEAAWLKRRAAAIDTVGGAARRQMAGGA